MKIFSILLLLLQFLLCSGSSCTPSKKPVSMTVLYEALCVDSQIFFRKFWPVFLEFQQCINLTLVPYGKAKRVAGGFDCQHGPQECWGNSMQNCALHANLNQMQQMQFVLCQMKDLKAARVRNLNCAKSMNIEKSVLNCLKFHTKQYQTEAADITDLYNFSEIPAIVYNGVFDKRIQKSDLRKTLCEMLRKYKHRVPKDC